MHTNLHLLSFKSLSTPMLIKFPKYYIQALVRFVITQQSPGSY